MLTIKDLPIITFVSPRREYSQLDLPQSGGAIRAIATQINTAFGPSTAPRKAGKPAETCGIIFKTGPLLLLTWLAVLDSGRTPVILTYPTRKLSHEYWLDTIRHTCAILDVNHIVAPSNLNLGDLVGSVSTLLLDEIPAGGADFCEAVDGDIIQLSSGTTGHKKAVRYNLSQLEEHCQLYNQALRLTEADRIVSWLPLYHDMGFIACFFMPLCLNVPLTLIDPIAWVADTSLLFDAIDAGNGTVCYLPNFSFEVLARAGTVSSSTKRNLSQVRRWISCSEPTFAATLLRFSEQHGIDPQTTCACYAMAENVFAVSLSNGLKTTLKSGQEYVSCGAPISGTELKIVADEIWVKSPTSISAYEEHGQPIPVADVDGYYPTGDIGFIENGELYVCGRVRDIMVQAGEKIILSDIDYTVNTVYPDAAGRTAALSRYNQKLATETLLIVIETPDPFNAILADQIRQELLGRLPVDLFEVELVPPAFITKTSSGKINRKRTAADFEEALRHHQDRSCATKAGPSLEKLQADLRKFGSGDHDDEPIKAFLDSLDFLSVQVTCGDLGMNITPETTYREIFDRAKKLAEQERLAKAESIAEATLPVLKIVSLMDAEQTGAITCADLEALGDTLGVVIHWENLCMPPAQVLYHELLFERFFMCRDKSTDYGPFAECIASLHSASIILFDDYQELFFPLTGQSYPVMDATLRRQAVADLACCRRAKVYQHNHLLPIGALAYGCDIDAANSADYIERIGKITGAETFKTAVCAEHAHFTENWDLCELRPTKTSYFRTSDFFIDKELFLEKLRGRLQLLLDLGLARLTKGSAIAECRRSDDSHLCSACINPDFIEVIAQRFNKFLIQGSPASVPYLRKRLDVLGKAWLLAPTARLDEILATDASFDCIIQAGAVGTPPTTLPIVSLQSADPERPDLFNMPADFDLGTVSLYVTPQIAAANIVKYLAT